MLAIIQYNSGNVQSVMNALRRIGAEATLTDNIAEIAQADKVIFPGVGEASSAMKYLKDRNLDSVIKNLTQPFLGICLGMQLLCKHSEEGNTDCMGIFSEEVKKFPAGHKVPHIGWNDITHLKSPLFIGIPEHCDMYFVHSYYAEKGNNTIAATDYCKPFSAALHTKNFYAVQFHPEKSAADGDRILKNFLSL